MRAALGRALAARARGRARAPLRRRRRACAPQRAAAARRHPPPRATPATSPSSGLPLPRQPRPRRRLPQAAASTSASPSAPSACRVWRPTSPIAICSTGTRARSSGDSVGAPSAPSRLDLRRVRATAGFAPAFLGMCLQQVIFRPPDTTTRPPATPASLVAGLSPTTGAARPHVNTSQSSRTSSRRTPTTAPGSWTLRSRSRFVCWRGRRNGAG